MNTNSVEMNRAMADLATPNFSSKNDLPLSNSIFDAELGFSVQSPPGTMGEVKMGGKNMDAFHGNAFNLIENMDKNELIGANDQDIRAMNDPFYGMNLEKNLFLL